MALMPSGCEERMKLGTSCAAIVFAFAVALDLTSAAAQQTDQPAGAVPARFGPVNPHRNPDGRLARGLHNQISTGNWSGYAVTDYQTGQVYTSAAATWQVP